MKNDIQKKMYIKLYYSMLDWRWYSDTNTFRVFMHLLLTANRKDHEYLTDTIHKGEALASLEFLSKNLNMSMRNVRTALKHLKATGEVTTRKIGKTTVIRLVNYNKYQFSDNITDNELTLKRQESDNDMTTKRQTDDNDVTTLRECKNEENEILRECVSEIRTHAHGKLHNVFITDKEYECFKERYSDNADDIIDQLSAKIATNDPKYQTGHIGHLYVFAENYKTKQHEKQKPSYDIDLAIKRSKKIDPTKTKKQ